MNTFLSGEFHGQGEPGGLLSMGLQIVRHDGLTNTRHLSNVGGEFLSLPSQKRKDWCAGEVGGRSLFITLLPGGRLHDNPGTFPGPRLCRPSGSPSGQVLSLGAVPVPKEVGLVFPTRRNMCIYIYILPQMGESASPC